MTIIFFFSIHVNRRRKLVGVNFDKMFEMELGAIHHMYQKKLRRV